MPDICVPTMARSTSGLGSARVEGSVPLSSGNATAAPQLACGRRYSPASLTACAQGTLLVRSKVAWLCTASGSADIEHKLLQKLRRLSMLKEVKKVLKDIYFLEFLGFAEISRPPPYSPPLKLFPKIWEQFQRAVKQ